MRGQYSVRQSVTVPDGQGSDYAKKYVRVPRDVMTHEIIPQASDYAAQELANRNVPKGQKLQVYRQLLSQYIEEGIRNYRAQKQLTGPQATGFLALPPGR